jgi:hypothetical protein
MVIIVITFLCMIVAVVGLHVAGIGRTKACDKVYKKHATTVEQVA